jgi:hypothetical protein
MAAIIGNHVKKKYKEFLVDPNKDEDVAVVM